MKLVRMPPDDALLFYWRGAVSDTNLFRLRGFVDKNRQAILRKGLVVGVNSGGGNLHSYLGAVECLNGIMNHSGQKVPVYTIGVGCVASAGTLLTGLGQVVLMHPKALYAIHGAVENGKDEVVYPDVMLKLYERISERLGKKLHPDMLRMLSRTEMSCFKGNRVADIGLADGVLPVAHPVFQRMNMIGAGVYTPM